MAVPDHLTCIRLLNRNSFLKMHLDTKGIVNKMSLICSSIFNAPYSRWFGWCCLPRRYMWHAIELHISNGTEKRYKWTYKWKYQIVKNNKYACNMRCDRNFVFPLALHIHYHFRFGDRTAPLFICATYSKATPDAQLHVSAALYHYHLQKFWIYCWTSRYFLEISADSGKIGFTSGVLFLRNRTMKFTFITFAAIMRVVAFRPGVLHKCVAIASMQTRESRIKRHGIII